MSITTFVKKYADEALGVAAALTELVGGVALPPASQAKVKAVIAQLQQAAANINAAPQVVIKKADIEAAVAAVLPKMVADAVAAALKDKQS